MRLVQVGMGGSGRVWARDHVPLVDEAELVGFVDRDQAALNVAQDEVGIASERCFTSLADALDALDPDAVPGALMDYPRSSMRLAYECA